MTRAKGFGQASRCQRRCWQPITKATRSNGTCGMQDACTGKFVHIDSSVGKRRDLALRRLQSMKYGLFLSLVPRSPRRFDSCRRKNRRAKNERMRQMGQSLLCSAWGLWLWQLTYLSGSETHVTRPSMRKLGRLRSNVGLMHRHAIKSFLYFVRRGNGKWQARVDVPSEDEPILKH